MATMPFYRLFMYKWAAASIERGLLRLNRRTQSAWRAFL
jgi:hypothetical protein